MTTEEAIQREALEVMSEEGLAGLSLRDVARRVGVTAPAIYRHFESKAHLVRKVVGSARAEAARFLEVRVRSAGCPEDRLRALIRGWIELAEERPGIYDTLASEPPDRPTLRFPDEFRSGAPPAFSLARSVVEECMEAGILRADDPLWVTLVFWSQLHGLVGLRRAGYFANEEMADVVDRVLARVVGGVGP